MEICAWARYHVLHIFVILYYVEIAPFAQLPGIHRPNVPTSLEAAEVITLLGVLELRVIRYQLIQIVILLRLTALPILILLQCYTLE